MARPAFQQCNQNELTRTIEPKSSATSTWQRWLSQRLLRFVGHPPLAVAIAESAPVAVDGVEPLYTVRLSDRGTLRRLLVDPLFQFGEAFAEGRLTIEGDLVGFLELMQRSLAHAGIADVRRGLRRFWKPRKNTLAGSRDNVHHHYDIGNDFYRLWLDEQMLYTCAYFASPGMTLEQAQVAKMDHVCRKLWLQPGDQVVEAGCGWGALAIHMAQHYGVSVTAYNISREQIRFARQRASALGLDGQVEFVEADWREIPADGRYDAFVSVGMLEHVGRTNYRQLGDVVAKCLRAEGRGLIHTIGRNAPRPFDRWIERRIFPGAYPPAFSEMTEIFEPSRLSLLDVENLRLHYAETCRHWLERFEQHADVIRQRFDDRFVRMWRLYLASSTAAFLSGTLQLFQVVFAPGGSNFVPRNREHLAGSYMRQHPDVTLFDEPMSDRPRLNGEVVPAARQPR